MSQVLNNAKIYYGAYDASGDMNSVSVDYSVDEVEGTVFGNATHGYEAGTLKTAAIGGAGFVDDSNASPGLFSGVGSTTAKVVTVSPQAGSEGDVAYFIDTITSGFNPVKGATGELNSFDFSAVAANDLIRGKILGSLSAATVTGQTTGQQIGAASSAQTVYAAIHVISGSGTLNVVVESDDNSGFTSAVTRLTFTTITGPTEEPLELVGPITDDWWRVNYTVTSGTWTFVVVLGIQ